MACYQVDCVWNNIMVLRRRVGFTSRLFHIADGCVSIWPMCTFRAASRCVWWYIAGDNLESPLESTLGSRTQLALLQVTTVMFSSNVTVSFPRKSIWDDFVKKTKLFLTTYWISPSAIEVSGCCEASTKNTIVTASVVLFNVYSLTLKTLIGTWTIKL